MRRDKRNDDSSDEEAASSASPKASKSGGSERYKMRDDLLTFGDDFWIEDADGDKAYKVDGKALRARSTLIFEDTSGKKCSEVQTKVAHVKDTMEIEDGNGKRAAIVKKALVTPVRERFTVQLKDGPELEVKGNIVDHEYKIGDVAEVSKKWFRVRDTYGVEVEAGQDAAVLLAVTVVIDQMEEAEEEGDKRP